MRGWPLVFAFLLLETRAFAFAGPESVAVIANKNDPDSVALAAAYAAARNVPARQVCELAMPQTDDVSIDDYRTKILAPFEACLTDGGVMDRIEAAVLMRGVPLRVAVPTLRGSSNVSVAAALALWHSTVPTDGGSVPVLDQPPQYPNPLLSLNGPYSAGVSVTTYGVSWKPLIVTMLTGRSLADAQKLLESAMDAEKNGGARGTFTLMQGGDSVRNWLDGEFPAVLDELHGLGFTDARVVPYDANLTGQTIAAFAVGTASIGQTIEGNTYLPGSIVDNLTSFGAVPQNFAASGEVQVSISRWVEKGVAGVHGTVDEPFADAFPDRHFISDYARGAPLGEAYFRRLPYAYWRNLVLGDPMLAPYAKRPKVAIAGITDGATARDAVAIAVTATDTSGNGIAKTQLYVDGVLAAEASGDTVRSCVRFPPRSKVLVLAVAQSKPGTGELAKFPPKGWTALVVDGQAGGATDCPQADGGSDAGGDATLPVSNAGGDAAGDDAGGVGDAGTAATPDVTASVTGGCSCRQGTSGSGGTAFGWWGAVVAVVAWKRRRAPAVSTCPPTAR